MVECQKCGISTAFNKNTLVDELTRLKSMQFQIPYLSCPQCNTHYTEHTLHSSVINNYFSDADIAKAIAETQYKNSIESETMIAARKASIDAQEKERKEKIAAEEKIRLEHIANMQAGKPFDPKIVGDVDMDESTPDERNCARVLSWEAKLYAYSFLALRHVGTVIVAIGTIAATLVLLLADFIWSILKKINWCIACSVGRMAYFVGYVGLIGYYIYRLINGLYLFDRSFYEARNFTITNGGILISDIIIILVIGIPVAYQLVWTSEAKTRWSKAIKKNIDKIINK
jgi:hypothetical protein